MRKHFLTSFFAVLVCCMLMITSVVSVSALDDKYDIDELGMSLKIPKEYFVITRTTEKSDDVFNALSLDYDDTMTAFKTADIYLQAVSDDGVLKITLTQTTDDNSKNINNYSELGSAQRKAALDTHMSDSSNGRTYTDGVERKHNDNIYFDLSFKQNTQSQIFYGYQCHTVINGMNINLTLEKSSEELTADEIKIITKIANSIDFDKIYLKSGPTLDWWRIILWVVVLIAVAVVAHHIYVSYNKNSKSNIKGHKKRDYDCSDKMSDADLLLSSQTKDDDSPSESKLKMLAELGFEDADDPDLFDESLGYDTTDYYSRANTDIESFDVKVKSKNRSRGVSYFEDDGKNINKKPDYFDSYFNEETEQRSGVLRFFSRIALYIKLAFVHLGYFFTNLKRMIFPLKKTKRKSRKR